MIIVYILAVIGLIMLWISPVIYIWCIREKKGLRDGLRDWLDDSADDI